MVAPSQRLGRLEDPAGDFPFYNGAPVSLSGGQWLLVMAAVVAGFMVLVLPIPWPAGPIGAWIPAVLFPLIPLLALANHYGVDAKAVMAAAAGPASTPSSAGAGAM